MYSFFCDGGEVEVEVEVKVEDVNNDIIFSPFLKTKSYRSIGFVSPYDSCPKDIMYGISYASFLWSSLIKSFEPQTFTLVFSILTKNKM